MLVVHGTTGTGFIAGGNAADPAAMERDRSCFDVIGRVLTAGAGRKRYAIVVALDAGHVVVPMADGGDVTIGVHVDARVVAQNVRSQAAS